MATKAKAAGEKINGAEGIETAMKNGSEALKSGFEKAVKSYDHLLGYGKETVEAYMKSANAAGKGAETLHNEIYSYSKQSVEDSMAADEGGSRFEVRPRGVRAPRPSSPKSAFDAYVGQMTKLSEIFTSTSKEAIEPLQGRVQAWVEIVQSSRAA